MLAGLFLSQLDAINSRVIIICTSFCFVSFCLGVNDLALCVSLAVVQCFVWVGLMCISSCSTMLCMGRINVYL